MQLLPLIDIYSVEMRQMRPQSVAAAAATAATYGQLFNRIGSKANSAANI